MTAREFVYSTDPAWCARCKHLPCVCKAAGPAGQAVGPQVAKVRLEKGGRGGKVVTVVGNLTMDAAQLKELLRTLQKACGTGGTVKDGNIEIQGDQRETVETRLQALGLKVKRAGG